MPSHAFSTPLVDKSQAQDFNLAVFKRMDEDIQEILYSATHVAVYEFDTAGKFWKRSDVEGTLFLIKRRSAPRFRIIVLNGKGTDNFIEEIDGSLESEVLQTFLLYTKGNNQLFGIWFYEEKNCEEFGSYLTKIVKGMPKATPVGTPKLKQSSIINPNATSIDISESHRVDGSNSEIRNELQSILNNFSNSLQNNNQSCIASSNDFGGSDHLLRLFQQAKERAPHNLNPFNSSADGFSNVSNLSIDPIFSFQKEFQIPKDSFNDTIGSSFSQNFGPLPPDFFKASNYHNHTYINNVISSPVLESPDPTLLPIPGLTSNLKNDYGLYTSEQNKLDIDNINETLRSNVNYYKLMGNHQLKEFSSDNDSINISNIRGRFRNALNSLLSNDDVIDLMILELKKAGININ